MEITEVRIKLMEDSDDRLQAFCSITFDNAFVVRDLKIIDGSNGPFVAMPSRKLTSHCPNCGYKNHLRAHFCNQCGSRQKEDRTVRDADGRVKLYADIAHPINAQCREQIQTRVIAEFHAELDRAQQPGYVSRYDEDYDLDFDHESEAGAPVDESRGSRPPRSTEPSSPTPPAPRAASPPPPHFPQSQRSATGVPVASEARGGDARGVHARSGDTRSAMREEQKTSLPEDVGVPASSPSLSGEAAAKSAEAASNGPVAAMPTTSPTASSGSSTPPRRPAKFGAGIFDPPAKE
ncbi:MAG: SpoVG family protein [Pirellulales bacterium]